MSPDHPSGAPAFGGRMFVTPTHVRPSQSTSCIRPLSEIQPFCQFTKLLIIRPPGDCCASDSFKVRVNSCAERHKTTGVKIKFSKTTTAAAYVIRAQKSDRIDHLESYIQAAAGIRTLSVEAHKNCYCFASARV